MTTIDTLLGYWAGYRPDKTAIVFGDRRVSFAEHHQRVLRCASALRSLGLGHGDSLAVMLPNCIELLELYRATALAGVVVVPVSPMLQARGVATVLHDCSAAAVVAHPSMKATMDAARRESGAIPVERWCMTGAGCPGYRGYEDLIAAAQTEAPLESVAADDVWQIMYSSGTTGAPKGIVMTHRMRAMYALTFASHLGSAPTAWSCTPARWCSTVVSSR